MPADWPTIARWRAVHYAFMERRNGLPSVAGTGIADAVWVLAVDGDGAPIAALSFFDAGGCRSFHDFYWRPGGSRAAVYLLAYVLRFTDELGLDSAGETNASNLEYRRLLGRFGFREYAADLARDVVFFRRMNGVSSVGKFEELVGNQREPGRARNAAAADAGANYRRGARE